MTKHSYSLQSMVFICDHKSLATVNYWLLASASVQIFTRSGRKYISHSQVVKLLFSSMTMVPVPGIFIMLQKVNRKINNNALADRQKQCFWTLCNNRICNNDLYSGYQRYNIMISPGQRMARMLHSLVLNGDETELIDQYATTDIKFGEINVATFPFIFELK